MAALIIDKGFGGMGGAYAFEIGALCNMCICFDLEGRAEKAGINPTCNFKPP